MVSTHAPLLRYSFKLLLLLLPAAAFGFRPFITDDAGTVPPVTFELETAVDYWNDRATFGLSFKHGITERMDIGIAFGRCVLPQDESGYDPAELLLKFSLTPDQLAASFSGSFGNGCYSANVIYSQKLSLFEIDANFGFSTESTPSDGFFTYALATILPVNQFSFGIEGGGTQASFDWWQTGVRYAFTPSIAIDAALGGTFSSERDLSASTGIFIAFPFSNRGN